MYELRLSTLFKDLVSIKNLIADREKVRYAEPSLSQGDYISFLENKELDEHDNIAENSNLSVSFLTYFLDNVHFITNNNPYSRSQTIFYAIDYERTILVNDINLKDFAYSKMRYRNTIQVIDKENDILITLPCDYFADTDLVVKWEKMYIPDFLKRYDITILRK